MVFLPFPRAGDPNPWAAQKTPSGGMFLLSQHLAVFLGVAADNGIAGTAATQGGGPCWAVCTPGGTRSFRGGREHPEIVLGSSAALYPHPCLLVPHFIFLRPLHSALLPAGRRSRIPPPDLVGPKMPESGQPVSHPGDQPALTSLPALTLDNEPGRGRGWHRAPSFPQRHPSLKPAPFVQPVWPPCSHL